METNIREVISNNCDTTNYDLLRRRFHTLSYEDKSIIKK